MILFPFPQAWYTIADTGLVAFIVNNSINQKATYVKLFFDGYKYQLKRKSWMLSGYGVKNPSPEDQALISPQRCGDCRQIVSGIMECWKIGMLGMYEKRMMA